MKEPRSDTYQTRSYECIIYGRMDWRTDRRTVFISFSWEWASKNRVRFRKVRRERECGFESSENFYLSLFLSFFSLSLFLFFSLSLFFSGSLGAQGEGEKPNSNFQPENEDQKLRLMFQAEKIHRIRVAILMRNESHTIPRIARTLSARTPTCQWNVHIAR